MRINQTTILIGIFGIVFIFFFGVSSIITIEQPDIVSVENNQFENEPVSTTTPIVEEITTTTYYYFATTSRNGTRFYPSRQRWC